MHDPKRRSSRLCLPVFPLLAVLLTSALSGVVQAKCTDADAGAVQRPQADPRVPSPSGADPRLQLQDLMRMAKERSHALGAVRVLVEAAKSDYQEARAGSLPTVSANGSLSGSGSTIAGRSQSTSTQARGVLNVGAPLWDAGRQTYLANWRAKLMEAAELGQAAAEEQVALQTVNLAIDRSRYMVQAQVYSQYSFKMACLVEALEHIAKVDKGRVSELVQAQKTRQQTEMTFEQTLAQLRIVENRLRRFVGEVLPPPASMSSVYVKLPDTQAILRSFERAPDIAQLSANALAQENLARSVSAGQKPQVSWFVSGEAQGGTAKATGVSAGINIALPVYNAAHAPAAYASRRRADAAFLQKEDSLETRRYRLLEMEELAKASFDRARQLVEILRNSDKLRVFTQTQWQEMGRRSLFDVMSTEGDYYNMRISHVNAVFDGQQAVASMWSLGQGVEQGLAQ